MACERKFNELRRQKIRIGTRDLRIAATALVHNLTLVTRNHKDFSRVPALRIEDWSVG
jgi:tRNA(fMet)-specific endonuclease VapC